MGKSAKVIIALVVVAVLAGGALWMASNKKDDDKSQHTTKSTTSDTSNSTEQSSGDVAATITYNGSGFSSSTDTIKAGDKVKVTNTSQDELQFDSDPHPVHTDNTELNVGDIGPGESKTFTIDKKGMWGYHNHLNSSQHGEITVQ